MTDLDTRTDTRTDARTLISPALFGTLTRRITADHPHLPDGMPDRIMGQALAFLVACATTTRPLGPSRLVDIGWHTFILHTADYADFCQRVAGRFIHHQPEPTEDEQPSGPEPIGGPVSEAIGAVRAAGYRIDPALWGSAADCTQCHAGCTDSPTGN
ncbi:glycine-rich domain-containing protein [Micromonospora sp. NPDC020750]|uniref:glycine-rich domain-containing protein n=1 Tax=unclassified Micromonospora TaxID=2617518 RepID=UPI00378D96AC